jgi:aspartate/methionine/tyrosine aminotransferase
MAAHPAARLRVVAREQLDDVAHKAEQRLLKNRELAYHFLDSRDDLEAFRPDFGTIVFPRLKTGSSARLCNVLREKYETSVVPGSFFEMPNHFRVGFGGDSEIFESGLERLGRALDHIR